MLILVNLGANGGKGAERWARVERELPAPFEAVPTRDAAEAKRLLARTRHDVVVAAGGDGTVNGVLNALVELGRRDVALGAIGLGSSNDFHKPFVPERTIAGVPVRFGPARLADIGRATLVRPDGSSIVRHFVLNASLGFVAEGNAFFNTDDPTLLWFKRRNVEAAILYTAFRNLRMFRPIETWIALDQEPAVRVPLANLGVLKKVHFAGGMKYDTPVVADDGMFDVNVWGRMNRADLVRTMANLYRGKFRGLPRTHAWRARRVTVVPEAPVHFETDGETTRIKRAELEVLPKALKICG